MYHAHHDEMTQIALGLTGMFVVHPRRDPSPVDRDIAIMLHEWYVEPGTSRPDPNVMSDFNLLTMNGRAYPGTDPLVVGHNDTVRIRFGNLSPMDHHPIHVHGHAWKIVATDGGRIPEAGQWPESTVLVPVGATRTVEFVADALGDWALHCHMTHHVMNQMGHEVPNTVGVDGQRLDRAVQPIAPGYTTMGENGMDEHGSHVEMGHMPVPENSIPMVGQAGPFGYITMGGMYTNLKVRPKPVNTDRDPGWWDHPAGHRRPRRDTGPGRRRRRPPRLAPRPASDGRRQRGTSFRAAPLPYPHVLQTIRRHDRDLDGRDVCPDVHDGLRRRPYLVERHQGVHGALHGRNNGRHHAGVHVEDVRQ